MGSLKVDKIRLEAEVISLKAQLEIYKGFFLAGAHWHQHNNNNVLVNRPITNNNIQSNSIETKVSIPTISEGISTQTTRNPLRMDNVMDELKNKIKLISAHDDKNT